MSTTASQHSESPGIMQRLVSVYFWVTLFLIPGLIFPLLLVIWLFTFLFDQRLIFLHKCTCLLSDITLGVNPYWKATVKGKEKVARETAYVMVSNHQSGADIMVLFKTHLIFKWVAKKSLFFFPFIGWNMVLNGYIAIERSRGRSKLKMMDKTIASINKGNSVMLFPEGTRTRDGRLQPFKTGAFRAAHETRTPILPIAIKGTYHAIRKGSLIINKSPGLQAVILDPIPYSEYEKLTPSETALMVHERISAEISLPPGYYP